MIHLIKCLLPIQEQNMYRLSGFGGVVLKASENESWLCRATFGPKSVLRIM